MKYLDINVFVVAWAIATVWTQMAPAWVFVRLHRMLPSIVYRGIKCSTCVAAHLYGILTLVDAPSTFVAWLTGYIIAAALAYAVNRLLDTHNM